MSVKACHMIKACAGEGIQKECSNAYATHKLVEALSVSL